MRRTLQHPWLNRFAWLTALSTLALIGIGGVVTSKGAGMAVPDWPSTYGYNMFLFPVHLWTGGIFYEHSHRLFASFVGLLTTVLAIWVWMREPRTWLRWVAVIAFVAVVLQGVLGGLRVTLFKDELGIFHATLAQAFFVLVTCIAFSLGGTREKWVAQLRQSAPRGFLGTFAFCATALILLQLVLGATMRHQHAGLAVPDFPLAYGQLWPPMDAAHLDQVNRARIGIQEFKPITAAQIALHMAHRGMAYLILTMVTALAWIARRQQGDVPLFRRLTGGWLALICVQALLGAATVWSNKAADVATAHVLFGALSLAWGAVLSWTLIESRQSNTEEQTMCVSHPDRTALAPAGVTR